MPYSPKGGNNYHTAIAAPLARYENVCVEQQRECKTRVLYSNLNCQCTAILDGSLGKLTAIVAGCQCGCGGSRVGEGINAAGFAGLVTQLTVDDRLRDRGGLALIGQVKGKGSDLSERVGAAFPKTDHLAVLQTGGLCP